MEVSRLSVSDKRFFSLPIRYSSPPALSTFFALSLRKNNHHRHRHSLRRRSYCSASNPDTLLTAGDAVVVAAGKMHDEEEEEEGDLKSWMHKHGLPPCKVVLKERASHNGTHKPIHYVAASQDLQVGDVALSVPISLVVTLERVLGNETVAELLTTNKFSELACLALYLMYEKKQGKKSFWYPYIRELDRQRGRGQLAVESPLLWSESELDYLAGSPLKAELIQRIEGIKREYNELDTVWFMAGSLFKQYPYDIPTEAFPFEIFLQAFAAVQSCVVHLQKVSLARRFALVPLGPPLLAYRSNCKAMLTAVEGAIELVVDRPYKAGDPIVVWCGPQPNSKLLINYGFVDEDNSFDRLIVEAALNTEDPQYQDKRMVAQRNGKLSIQAFQVHVGKEREAVSDMIPYLRLGYVSDPSEMESVISSQGPVCPVSPCMERAVLDQLADYFKTRLAGYPTTLAEDESMLADGNLNPKKRVATQFVRLEKKMLHACLQATIDFINQLPDHSVSPCPAPYAPLLK
ncbi:ribulose-1,5 bisphosphate carboxylase/oxygenase large subunit N-methyltransferase, chloroplastic [Gastrolobium bilobum]|uniref:ribulose-1,5 bisphosphate carboxylase/oxygenase large subunit N-methyltransferase, chloroplastic n=1 Tax=Gastrolobium bilobum TaxID=150636 RepID=UPI002AB21EC6|nr:ribulose-1,5 bisphosphate carboxylase/oxygenase large subunit N-methyltransferase, chloroplastic [Gastrolobium bilobum]